MASSQRQKKRRAIFDQAVKAFQSVTGRPERWCFCPLCERAFTEQHLEDGTLSLEHVPPEALGGRELVLTCSECNSTAGTKVDSQAVRREEVRAFMKAVASGGSSYSNIARLTIGGVTLNCSLTVDPTDRTMSLAPSEKHNDPQAVRKYREQLGEADKQGTWDRMPFSLGPARSYHPQLARLSDLRAGYLLAFAKLGYRYAFHPRLDPVREQLRNPDEEIITGFSVSPTGDQVIVIAERPIEALWVVMPQAAVLLPWPPSKVDPYQRMAEMHEPGSKVTIHGLSMPWPSRPEMVLDFPGRDS